MGRIKNVERVVIYQDLERYTYEAGVAQAGNGDLLVTFSEDRGRTHSDFGSLGLIRSSDGGATWDPATRTTPWRCTDHTGTTDPAITCLSDGTIYVHFLICAFVGKRGILEDLGPQSERQSENMKGLRDWEGIYLIKSTDHGHSWSTPYRANTEPMRIGYAPETLVELPSGIVLMACQGMLGLPIVTPLSAAEPMRTYLLRSDDRGENWEHYSTVAFDPAGIVSFMEPGMARSRGGHLVCLMRTGHQPRWRHQHLWLAVSNSEGESWSRPEATNIWGYPANLLLLRDGRMLATYGYRRSPWGVRACLSDDGLSWDVANEVVICEGGVAPPTVPSFYHIGYPVTIQMADGSLFMVHHEWTASEPFVQYVVGYRFELD